MPYGQGMDWLEITSLALALLLSAYLVYALLRGENL
jgi:K+-transporting ATPase KdpF subunit